MKKLRVCTIILLTLSMGCAFCQDFNTEIKQARDYFNHGKYIEAETICRKWLAAIDKQNYINDTAYQNLWNLAGMCYVSLENYNEALLKFQELGRIIDSSLIKDDSRYALNLYNQADCYYNLEKYDTALTLFNKACSIQKDLSGTRRIDYALTLNKLGLLNSDLGNLDDALQYYTNAKNIFADISGTKSYNYAMVLNNMAYLYDHMGNYDTALICYDEAIPLFKDINGTKNADYASALNNKAILYFHLGKYNDALPLYQESKNIRKEVLGEKHIQYAVSVNNLATLYESMGNYMSALPLYKEAYDIILETNGKHSQYYAMAINNLGGIYDAMGNYEEALSCYIQATTVFKEILGEKSPYYTSAFSGLALVYWYLGDYETSLSLWKEDLAIEKDVFGTQHPSYAMSLNNMANVYSTMGNYKEALPLYQEARKIRLETLGTKHPDYATSLNCLAKIFGELGLYDTAFSLFKEEIEVSEASLGKKHPYYATSLNNLAFLYYSKGNFIEALPLFEESRKIRKESLGNEHVDVAKSSVLLANTYTSIGNFKEALPLYQEANKIITQQIRDNFSFLSNKEKGKYVSTFRSYYDYYNSFLNKAVNLHPELSKCGFDNELLLKGLVLSSVNALQQSIIESNDTSLINKYEEMRSLKQIITSQYQKRIERRRKDLADLEKQANDLERELSHSSEVFNKIQAPFMIKYEDVQKKLTDEEAAIEFVKFRYSEARFTDSIYYGVYVLFSYDTLPKYRFLCEERWLKKALPSFQSGAEDINLYYLNQALYALIWQPLDSLLEGIKTVYFSPSGLLNKVSFSTILCPDNKILMEKYNLVQLSSTRSLAMPMEPLLLNTAGVFGGIKYDSDTVTMIAQAKKYQIKNEKFLVYNRSAQDEVRRGFIYLPGTQKEADLIYQKMVKNGIPTMIFTGENASEESFLAISGNSAPSLIHFATHGFYYPDTISEENRKKLDFTSTGELQFRIYADPLQRSGLLMSGANIVWNGGSLPEGVEDGILTAREISNMNLLNTQLVVLSACQTGLGDVKGSEGVEGLQRGFKMAGVRYIMMSLWEIPDRETTEFMEAFYDNWLGGQEIRDAFRNTQLKMKNKYRDEPFKWAGFVLME